MSEPKTYDIHGKKYRLESLSWRQGEWLKEHVFQDLDLSQASSVALTNLLQAKAPLLLAVCLIEEGQSKRQKSEAGFVAVQALAEEIALSLSPAEVKAMGQDFFSHNPFENLWQCVTFHPLPAPPAASIGSPPASVSLQEETSPGVSSS